MSSSDGTTTTTNTTTPTTTTTTVDVSAATPIRRRARDRAQNTTRWIRVGQERRLFPSTTVDTTTRTEAPEAVVPGTPSAVVNSDSHESHSLLSDVSTLSIFGSSSRAEQEEEEEGVIEHARDNNQRLLIPSITVTGSVRNVTFQPQRRREDGPSTSADPNVDCQPSTIVRMFPSATVDLVNNRAVPWRDNDNTDLDTIDLVMQTETLTRSLPTWRYQPFTSWPVAGMKFNSRMCIICRSEFNTNEQVLGLACQHVFHNDCILHWFQTNVSNNAPAQCPLCREWVLTEQ